MTCIINKSVLKSCFAATLCLAALSCGKKCEVVSVDSTGSTSHTHTSTTIFDVAKTYSKALTAATAGNAHDHDITLTDSHVTGMAAGRIDVTSTATDSHSHTAGIECKKSGLF